MQKPHVRSELNFEADSPDANQALRVVIAYNDLAAGKRAMRVMASLGNGLGDDIELEPLPWSFDLLEDVDWRGVATRDAVNADIVIVATSDTRPLPPAVKLWVEEIVGRKRGLDAAVVALFGPAEKPDEIDSSRLGFIQSAARRAGLDFFAPGSEHELDETFSRNHQSSEMAPFE